MADEFVVLCVVQKVDDCKEFLKNEFVQVGQEGGLAQAVRIGVVLDELRIRKETSE